jgi:hypothetical protein
MNRVIFNFSEECGVQRTADSLIKYMEVEFERILNYLLSERKYLFITSRIDLEISRYLISTRCDTIAFNTRFTNCDLDLVHDPQSQGYTDTPMQCYRLWCAHNIYRVHMRRK